MTSPQSLRAGLTLTISALGALWLGACGGSTSVFDNTGGSAGSANVSGSGGVAGNVSHGGAGGSAGASGSHAGGSCGAFCPALQCAPGYTWEPGECCPVCVPNGGTGGSGASGGSAGFGNAAGVGGCGDIACTNIGCGPGTTPVIEPGNCCPTCVPNDEACAAGTQGYQTLFETLLAQPGARSCMVDDDCTLLTGSAQCGAACSASPVNSSQAMEMTYQLSLWEKSYCSTCSPIYPPCVAPPQPVCNAGVCEPAYFL